MPCVHDCQSTVEALPIPAYVFSIDRPGVLFANSQFCELMDYSEEELIKKPWSELLAPEEVPLAVEAIRSGSPRTSVTWRFVTKNGELLSLVLRYRKRRLLQDDGQVANVFFVAVIGSPKERQLPAALVYGGEKPLSH